MVAKLTYFNMTGLGEPVRLMLSAAKIDFIDNRITAEEWAKMKQTLRWPHLPLLEIDGKALNQSRAICRYIARKAGLLGCTEYDAVLADMTVDALDDMRQQITKFYYGPDSPAREEGLTSGESKVIPFYLKNFQDQLVENNGYLVGGKLTWADIMLLSYIDYLGYLLDKDLVAEFPKLEEHIKKIKLLPGIKEHLASRPGQIKDLRLMFK